MKVAIVAPCHIPPSEAWIAALESEAKANKAKVIIVDDSDGKLGDLPKSWDVYNYRDQQKFLGDLYDDFARLFHKSSSCRVFGHIIAYVQGYEAIIGLDSDCIVKRNFVRDHIQFLGQPFGSGWFNPIGYPKYSRGYPYSQRGWEVVANMGLWENVLDINGKDREEGEPKEIKIAGSTVPSGPFPFSGMNWCIKREYILYYLFLPNFYHEDNNFRRIDDVWGGYIFQRFLRVLKKSTLVGYPFVFHDTIVDAKADAEEEEPMYKYEDDFYAAVDKVFEEMYTYNADDSIGVLYSRFRNHFMGTDKKFAGLYEPIDLWFKIIQRYA